MAIKKYLKYLWLYDTTVYLEESWLQIERIRVDLTCSTVH